MLYCALSSCMQYEETNDSLFCNMLCMFLVCCSIEIIQNTILVIIEVFLSIKSLHTNTFDNKIN